MAVQETSQQEDRILVSTVRLDVTEVRSVVRRNQRKKMTFPVLNPDGTEKSYPKGTVFRNPEHASKMLNHNDDGRGVQKLMDEGFLQWRSPNLAHRMINSPQAPGNNVPVLEFQDVDPDQKPAKGEDTNEGVVLRGTNLDYDPMFLNGKDEDELRVLYAKADPNAHVEDMDKDLLVQLLSKNYKA